MSYAVQPIVCSDELCQFMYHTMGIISDSAAVSCDQVTYPSLYTSLILCFILP